jgi:hypothetical protein
VTASGPEFLIRHVAIARKKPPIGQFTPSIGLPTYANGEWPDRVENTAMRLFENL